VTSLTSPVVQPSIDDEFDEDVVDTSDQQSGKNNSSASAPGTKNGTVSVTKRKVRAPKKAFTFYCEDSKSSFKLSNPLAKAPEILTLQRESWKSLSKKDRVGFQQKADKDKLRYEQECAMSSNCTDNKSD